MDTITQGLIGATVAQCGFRQRIGGDATWVAFAAAATPDADVFIAPLLRLLGRGSIVNGWLYHRGFSHALLFIPVLAGMFALPWWLLRRRFARKRGKAPPSLGLLFGCCVAAVATHGLLDACTSYGTQLLWPFTSTRYAWDCVPIVDLIYTPILILTLLVCWGARLAGRRKPDRARRVTIRLAVAGLVLSTAYLLAGRVAHDLALQRALRAYPDLAVTRAEAYPMLGSIFLWRVVLRTAPAEEGAGAEKPGGWMAVRVHLFASPDTAPRSRFAAATPDSPTIHHARTTRVYEVLQWFADDQLRHELREQDGRTLLDVHDMRYARSPDGLVSLWPIRFVFGPDGDLLAVGRAPRPTGRDRGELARRAWDDLWNP